MSYAKLGHEMSYKVIRSFVLKTNGTRNNVNLTVPVQLNPNKEYYVKLMSFRFQNVFCNLIGDITASPNNSWTYRYKGTTYTLPQSSFLTPAIGELTVLYNWLKVLIQNQCGCDDKEIAITINGYGKVDFIFSSNFTNINFIGGCLNTDYFGRINTITSNDSTSTNMPIVSSFNSILVTCSLLSNTTYVQDANNNLSPTSVMCSVNAALSPFEMVDYSAVQPIMYNLTAGTNITGFTCELRDDNNNELIVLPSSTTDFNIWLQILEVA